MTVSNEDVGRTAIRADEDVEHLLDLLRLLPGPEHQRFWAAIGTEGEDTDPTDSNLKYVFEKMSLLTDFLDDSAPKNLVKLCIYLLMFFSGERPAIWEALKELDHGAAVVGPDVPGRLWAEDITRTAWTLYVRYQDYGDESWQNKWADKNWLNWMPYKQQR